MINEPRTYRHSPIQLILVIILLGIFSIGALMAISQAGYIFLIPFALFLGIIFLTVLYSMTQKTIISDDGISAQTIFGEKPLRWSEISRVSGRGYAIKLHNFDGDVTVAPSPQLPGYEEVVEWIGIKRPDLFDPLEYGEMKRGMPALALIVALMVVLIGVAVVFGLLYLSTPETSMSIFMPLIFIIIIFIVFFVVILFQPQSVTLDGKSLCLKYLFGEKTLLADEISSVELRFTQTRNGKNYFVLLTQTNKKSLRISGLNLGLPIVYLTLKNWHKKNTIGLTTQQN
jgi:hypothetical protein